MKFSIRHLLHLTLALTLIFGVFDLSVVQAFSGEEEISAEESDCCPDEHEDAEDECLEDCSAGCCASHAPAPATLFVAQLRSDSIKTPLLTRPPDGETCRGFSERVFQPPRA